MLKYSDIERERERKWERWKEIERIIYIKRDR